MNYVIEIILGAVIAILLAGFVSAVIFIEEKEKQLKIIRDIIADRERVNAVVDWIVLTGSQYTISGKYYFFISDIVQHFSYTTWCSLEWVCGNLVIIVDGLRNRKEVYGEPRVEYLDDICIHVDFKEIYCPLVKKENKR